MQDDAALEAHPHPVVVCVLGCRAQSRALARRAKAAAETYFARGATVVVACGGRSWVGEVEADELARLMIAAGVPPGAIVRERCSLDTRDNARFAASLLRRRGLSRVTLVTCVWHLPRAERAFRAAELEVEGVAVAAPDVGRLERLYRSARERVATWNDARRTMKIV